MIKSKVIYILIIFFAKDSLPTLILIIYATALIGKWHISNPVNLIHPHEHGIDYYEGIISGVIDDYYSWEKVKDGQVETVNEFFTKHITDSAINWIDQRSDPWFLWLAHVSSHSPLQVPPEGTFSVDNPTSNRQLYNANIENLDFEIGRLLDSMDQETRDNTIVVFIGDNGTQRCSSRVSNQTWKGNNV